MKILDIWSVVSVTLTLICICCKKSYPKETKPTVATLTPPDTWSCPTLGLACVLMTRPISPELVLSPDFRISLGTSLLPLTFTCHSLTPKAVQIRQKSLPQRRKYHQSRCNDCSVWVWKRCKVQYQRMTMTLHRVALIQLSERSSSCHWQHVWGYHHRITKDGWV